MLALVLCVLHAACAVQLALKLHPDKNRAHRADEAFKAVGKAFACLSDPDKVRSGGEVREVEREGGRQGGE